MAILLAAVHLASWTEIASAQDPPPTSGFSQYLRSQGFTLTDEEAAYFDADEKLQASFSQSLVNLELLVAMDPAQRPAGWRDAVVGELNRLLGLTPDQAPAAPPTLQRLRELGIAQRAHVLAAAREWLRALESGQSEWWLQGNDQMRAAREAMATWQQELLTRYPPNR
jgi:hypothetical protein